MWEIGEGFGSRKRKAHPVTDRNPQNYVPIATAEMKNTCFYEVSLSNLRNSQNRGSEPVSFATTEPNNGPSSDFLLSVVTTVSNHASSNLGTLQNPGSNYVSISNMSDRLGLLAKVENHANKIFRQVEVQIRCKGKNKRNALIAACIYIACRQMDTTRSLEEISSVANEAKPFDISEAVGALAETLGINKNSLLHIEPADFTTRFCNALEVDSQGVKAAYITAKRYSNKVNSCSCNRIPHCSRISHCSRLP